MAAPLINSHPFNTAVCERARSWDSVHCRFCGFWHGGIKCDTCGMPKYNHVSKDSEDYRYSSWSVSRALRDEISGAWVAMHDYRRAYQSAKNENSRYMDSYGLLADSAATQVRSLLRVHNYGLGRYASLECTHKHLCRATVQGY